MSFELTRNPRYFINEISPSRKEIRLLGRIDDNTDLPFDTDFIDDFQTKVGTIQSGTYNFNHVIRLQNGSIIPITNYTFDITSPDNASLILRLNTPIPSEIQTLSIISIEQQLIDSQQQNIYYVSNVVSTPSDGGLSIDETSFQDLINAGTNDTFQNYNELIETSSITNTQFELITGSVEDQYLNLNTDFTEFANHTFFGSAKSKLQNFKTKVIQIEDYLTEISQSLTVSQSSDSSDIDYKAPKHIRDRREVLFSNIYEITSKFTPYERFLYYDNQTIATSSAPGIGVNLADSLPVTQSSTLNILNKFDGFTTVYKTSGSAGDVHLFSDKYYAQQSPFHNHSGSIYLSFLLKSSGSEAYSLTLSNTNTSQTPGLPSDAFGGGSIIAPTSTGSSYRRYIYKASQSWWEPIADNLSGADFGDSSQFTILSGSNITGSSQFNAPDGYSIFPKIFDPDETFSGSVMPMGELFNLKYNPAGSEISSSYITDVKLSLQDPSNTLPFSHVYSTGSSEWIGWYDGWESSASAYDTANIHSLVNNLPKNIREDDDVGDLKTFLHMWGEHFDLLRGYIDNYGTFYKQQYKKQDSTPSNLLPILSENLGWELINPFSSSISDYYTDQTYGDNGKDIANNTWRKVLNNLVYIYKSKGTRNSVQALLNTYGYPSDILTIDEFGGSTTDNEIAIEGDVITPSIGLASSTGNVSFIQEPAEFIAFDLTGERQLGFDWYTNNTTPDSLEFVFASKPSTNNQILVESSGSGARKLWDLKLLSDNTLQFRLNKSLGAVLSIDTNNISLTTPIPSASFQNGKLWNVLLQRATSSTNSNITQSYELCTSFQVGNAITEFLCTSASVSNSFANGNFTGTGSYSEPSGNLIFGRTLSGSMGEIRAWTGSLSASKFKQHTLNKFSTIGNSGENSDLDLIYRFRLNENYTSGSTGNLVDANSNNNGDYSRLLAIANNGTLYNSRLIDVAKFSLRFGGQDQRNDNKIIFNPIRTMIKNLDPMEKSFIPISNVDVENKRRHSYKLEMVRSINKRLNDHIINQLSDVDITDKFADPQDLFNDNYSDLDTLRDKVYTGVSIDVNKFIDAQAPIFNSSLISSVKTLLPARSSFNNIGVQIDQSLLERSKVKQNSLSIATGSDAGLYEMDLGRVESISYNFNTSTAEDTIDSEILRVDSIINLDTSTTEFDKKIGEVDISSGISFTSTEFDDISNLPLDIISSTIDLSNSNKFDNILSNELDMINDTISLSQSKLLGINDIPEININLNVYSLSNSNYDSILSDDIKLTSDINFNSNYDSILSDNINLTSDIDFISNYDSILSADVGLTLDINSNYDSILSDNINLASDIDLNSSYESISSDDVNLISNVDLNSSYESISSDDVELTSGVELTSNYDSISSDDVNLISNVDFNSSYESLPIGKNLQVRDFETKGYDNLTLKWGETINDTHFINFQETLKLNERSSGSNGDYNVNYHEDRFTFLAIGDYSVISSSFNSAGNPHIDYTDDAFILNERIHTDGRSIGRTHKFSTASNGDIIYPENHYTQIGTSRQSIRHLIYDGSQNGMTGTDEDNKSIYLSKGEWPHKLDLFPTASFYSITVAGADTDTVLRVDRPADRLKS